ncbi:peptidoglycan-binding LysM [Fibrella aestuarina BUZ 2]|uniref:Peptidoglycan-binding LysM n=1 Tax=Fibrella aestuarina BUZ 2 TaxID=1166018 RepID=I0KD65_9BACT|nr:LysM peptidoglycan-binding domain-containing protein [Fibrella aestuarina]CCH02068.1 peptidoglycan-binding LysM [Fibrella aestuarina BUZ 2]
MHIPITSRWLLAVPTWLIVSQLADAAPTTDYTHGTTLPFDSIGVERREGRRFVLHRVDQGQTLFAVARRYRTSVEAILAANPDISTGSVRYDQLLHVPMGESVPTKKEQREADKAARKDAKDKARLTTETERTIATDVATQPTAPKPRPRSDAGAGNGTHVVESGQTLYSLAARYGVSMANLRQWNNLGADGIRVGQTLVVSEKAYQAKTGTKAASRKTESAELYTPSTKTKTPDLAPLDTKPLITPEPPLAPGSKPKPKPKPATTETAEAEERTQPTRRAEPVAETRPAPPKTTEPSSDNEPVAATTKAKAGGSVHMQSEVGFADVIEGDNQSSKYLALHRSAPVGTLVQVRNDISNQSLYVKVVGKLPDTGLNDQVLIRLSNRAFEKLSPNGQRFRAEVSYAK